ncbi:hypothetical protein D3C76_845550 [compost metagenome]
MNSISRLALYATLMFFGANAWAEKTANQTMLEALVAAKFSGGCGIISQMNAFQMSTKMPGGSEFLERFLNTEAARLGITPPQYVEQCRKTADLYQSWYDVLNEAPAP